MRPVVDCLHGFTRQDKQGETELSCHTGLTIASQIDFSLFIAHNINTQLARTSAPGERCQICVAMAAKKS